MPSPSAPVKATAGVLLAAVAVAVPAAAAPPNAHPVPVLAQVKEEERVPVRLAMELEVESPRTVAPVGAPAVIGLEGLADEGTTAEAPAATWRTFGHRPSQGHWFDNQGNWADTDTYVTADQYAAMPPAQQQNFLKRTGKTAEQVAVGNPDRVILRPAAGTLSRGVRLDRNRSTRINEDGTRSFGHRPVKGHYFRQGRWADTRTLVSADQAAAMGDAQRQALAASAGIPVSELKLGDAERAVVQVITRGENERLAGLAQRKPNTVVVYHEWNMTARTAAAFSRLEARIAETFPGREVRITSTMGGRHTDPDHRSGEAIDFVVSGLTKRESKVLEKLCWQSGFEPYNEYIKTSRFKTGDHMHVSLPD